MSRFFTRERFAEPQFVAGLLLLIFLAQGAWLVSRTLATGKISEDETFVLVQGLAQWHGQRQPASYEHREIGEDGGKPWEATSHPQDESDRDHSPLYYLVASAPLLLWPGRLQPELLTYWGWLAHAPFLFFGVMLGASVWYVARRLYGNAGGYVALTLYCFSPGFIRSSAMWYAKPETGAAWGAFGSIFTAIAVSHTLYAPREVVVWNWRRIVLLGISLALAVGSQFSLIVLLPLALGFLLYLAPDRRGAGAVIWAASCAVGCLLIFASCFFHPNEFWQTIRHARWLGYSLQSFGVWPVYRNLLQQLGQLCPALIIAVPASLVAYVGWGRTRYFGNSAPLLVAGLFLLLGLASPHYPGMGFRLLAVPLLFLFVAGITSDLMETHFGSLVQACAWGLLAAYGAWSLMELARVART